MTCTCPFYKSLDKDLKEKIRHNKGSWEGDYIIPKRARIYPHIISILGTTPQFKKRKAFREKSSKNMGISWRPKALGTWRSNFYLGFLFPLISTHYFLVFCNKILGYLYKTMFGYLEFYFVYLFVISTSMIGWIFDLGSWYSLNINCDVLIY